MTLVGAGPRSKRLIIISSVQDKQDPIAMNGTKQDPGPSKIPQARSQIPTPEGVASVWNVCSLFRILSGECQFEHQRNYIHGGVPDGLLFLGPIETVPKANPHQSTSKGLRRLGSWSSRGVAYSTTSWKCAPLLANRRSRSDPVLNLYNYKLSVASYSATLTAKVKQINPMEESKGGKGGLGNAM